MTFVRLAARNVLRNRRRSIITAAAITLGLAALIFLWAFIDGVNEQMIENSTSYLSGHLQIHRAGYHEDRTLDLLLADPDRVEAHLRKQPEVEAFSRRMEGNALLSAGEKSRGVMVVGIDPDREAKVTTLSRALKSGRFLAPNDRDAIVLGDLSAAALNAEVGSEVVLLTQAADGSVGAGRYRVQGIFDTRMDMIDGLYVFLPLGAAQELYASGSRVTSIAARLKQRDTAAFVVARLQQALGATEEVLGWDKLVPNVTQSVSFHEVIGYVLLLVLFVVVAVGITNTMLMAVLERTREFGVMMALGTNQLQIMRLIFYEACLLGSAGLVTGGLIGGALSGYFASRGMDLSRYARAVETMPGLTSIIYPFPRADRVLLLSALVFVTAIVAALYPASRAVRLAPVEAIRGIRHAVIHWGRITKTSLGRMRWPLFWKIAVRGIARNPRRTLLTVTATSFGLTAFVFLLSFVGGYLTQIADNSTGYLTGHLQIQHPDFRKEFAPELALRSPAALLERVRADPFVAAAAPRVQAQALASSPQQAENFMLLGIDPAMERKVTFIDRAVTMGAPLQPGQDRNIVIGRKLAEKLGVRIGEKIVVMTQATDGSLGSAAYRLSGIFTTESEAFDTSIGFVTLQSAQGLLALGDGVSTIAMTLADRERLDDAAASLRSRLAGTPYAVVTWQELLPEVEQMIGYIKAILRIIVGIVFAVVAMGVMNTLIMSVMERTRELGIMMALGTSPGAVMRLVLYESLVLAVIGTITGLVLGIAIVAYLGSTGIDMSRYTQGLQTIPGLTGIIYPRFAGAEVWVPVWVLLLISVAAALYPAWRAARLDPVQAIRHG